MSKKKPIAWLGSTITDEKALKREYRRRRSEYVTTAVHPANREDMLASDWELERELKTKLRFRKRKLIDERLEDRFWCVLCQMGYHELNDGRNFRIKIKKKNSPNIEKQIDVFAKDDETVIIAECKSSKEIKKRSLQKDIGEFSSLKSGIANAIRSHYGSDFRPKIVWLFVTEKIIWSKPDIERARSNNIHIITERELRYFAQIVDHLGPAASINSSPNFLRIKQSPH